MQEKINALGQPSPNRTDFKDWSRERLEQFARDAADENLILCTNNKVLLEQWRAEVAINEELKKIALRKVDTIYVETPVMPQFKKADQ